MYAIRARRKTVTEKDFLDAVNKGKPPCCSLCSMSPEHRGLLQTRRLSATQSPSVWEVLEELLAATASSTCHL